MTKSKNKQSDKLAKAVVLTAVTIAGGPVIGPIGAMIFDKILEDD